MMFAGGPGCQSASIGKLELLHFHPTRPNLKESNMDIKNTTAQLEADNSDLSGSRFNNVNLAGSTFNDINLSGAKFSDVNLQGVEITDCNIDGLLINGVSISELIAKQG